MSEHKKEECPQGDRLLRIEDELSNHKVWRKETSTLLADIHLQTAAQTERLRYFTDKMEDREGYRNKSDKEHNDKIDEHIKEGNAFRRGLILTAFGLLASVVTAIFGYGMLWQQVQHMDKALSYIEDIHPRIGK